MGHDGRAGAGRNGGGPVGPATAPDWAADRKPLSQPVSEQPSSPPPGYQAGNSNECHSNSNAIPFRTESLFCTAPLRLSVLKSVRQGQRERRPSLTTAARQHWPKISFLPKTLPRDSPSWIVPHCALIPCFSWGALRTELLAEGGLAAYAIQQVESAAFVLCLDGPTV